jgi:hypothetical protein
MFKVAKMFRVLTPKMRDYVLTKNIPWSFAEGKTPK